MRISELCINRPVMTTMAVLALIVFGGISYMGIGSNMFPDVDVPVVTVTVLNPGMAPETMDRDIADKIEESVGTISGIDTLRSQSLEGITQVFIEFELEEDVDVKAQDVRDKISLIRRDLPSEIEEPTVEKLDLDVQPIMSILVAGPLSVSRLTRIADERIKPLIETIPGVGNIRMVGDRDREIRIWLRADDLRSHHLTAQDVINVLRQENLEPPGGRVETGNREIIVKTKGKLEKVADFADIIVKRDGQRMVRLSDVGYVEDGMEDCRGIARLNGQLAVCLQVRPQSGTNMVAVAHTVKARLDEIRQSVAEEQVTLTIAQDNSVFVNASIEEAEGELMRGAALAVLVIFLFLRSLRGSFVAACTIPTTIIGTYAFMYAMGFTANMMTMLALTISVGMIIDDSIVVLENTYRHMEAGHPRIVAARMAINEIGFAVIVTSLAIAAVFIPVAFMEGLVGQFFFEFGLTVTAAVFISTVMAVTLSPMLCGRVLVVSKSHGFLFRFVESILGGTEKLYRRILDIAINSKLKLLPRISLGGRFTLPGVSIGVRWFVIGGAIAFFASSLYIAQFLGDEFVPQADEDQFNIHIEAAVGTSITASDHLLQEIERRLVSLPAVVDIFTTIGAGVEERVNVATVLVKLTGKKDRSLSQFEIMDRAREKLHDLKHLKTSVEIVPRVSASGVSTAVYQYVICGTKQDEIVVFSKQMEEELAKVGLIEVNSTWDDAKPELEIHPNRKKAQFMGVSTQDVGNAIYALVGGVDVTTFESDGETFDVRMRLVQQDRDRTDSVLSIPVRTDTGELIEIRNVVDSEDRLGPVQVDRIDRMRQITINASLPPGMMLGDAVRNTGEIESRIGLPPGVTTRFSGEAENMGESFASIGVSMGLAVLLIYMVLAAQFESLLHPLTIMVTLPLSITGALGALLITNQSISIFSLIGIIMLMGLVTKNAILLIDYTNQLRSQGRERNVAVLEAGPIRLRPILMTTCSTIMGMLPAAMGLGEGAETRSPMGACIVGGMITSTVLTLLVIPVVYTVLDDIESLVLSIPGKLRSLLTDGRKQTPTISASN
ncbi:efflux RND transporter permease subunit [Novipirellula artificiosorum]|uniref:Multidrug resistance protein MdtB n=1 Tax=Novipirellula artificiosorum TaxID=2528016 RepID=A0A5C6DBH1_9BACT|nr:efflux RND transporter permease subunit [Novipirellula artificiosorum]TWU32536.1 Multidrug resistance protein MdtB [Novipirellula artificiosorum]